MNGNKQQTMKDLTTFKIVDVDFKDGWTITTLLNKDKLNQQHIPLNVIENFFGGKNKIQGGNNEN